MAARFDLSKITSHSYGFRVGNRKFASALYYDRHFYVPVIGGIEYVVLALHDHGPWELMANRGEDELLALKLGPFDDYKELLAAIVLLQD